MKKKLIGILLIFIGISLTSCKYNSGYYFIEGSFYSEKNVITDNGYSNEDYQHGILTIKKIDKQTYLEANGLNVVKDVSSYRKGDYFLIELLVFSKEKNDYIQLNYYNLKREEHRHVNMYLDDNDYYISPRESKQYKNDSCKYYIGYNEYYSGFYLKASTDD